jgi:drug/metabolite transporter superfamily protein YnfA
MLILGIVLLVVGALVAAFVHHTIGIIIAAVGGILVLVALLFLADTETAEAIARSSWSVVRSSWS